MSIIKNTNLSEEELKRLNEDIEATRFIMLRNNGSYGLIETLIGSSPFNNRFESLYTNATEDMNTYYKAFTTTDSFLTIGASGEQVVNAINSGAKTIDVYDSNPLCRHALFLRLGAIKALNYEEFFEFYRTFSPRLFKKIIPYLNEEESLYWQTIYSMFGPNINIGKAIATLLFTYKRLDEELIKKINPYLNPENYEKLKSLIDSVTINYIDSDLYSLPKHITKKSYDVINLSNIYEYLNYGDDTKFKHARKYRNFVMNEMYPHLNHNGTMLVSYLYAWNDALNEDFAKMYKESNGKVISTGAITFDQYFYYLQGLTTQNLSYHFLFETFKNDPIEKIPTEHVQFGQSKDMSHDLALILRK